MKQAIAYIVFSLFSIIAAQSQPGFSASYQRGFLLPHHANMQHLPNHAAQAIEIRLSHQTNGLKTWQRLYNFPSFDYTVKYFNLGNENVLGTGIGAAIIFSKPMIRMRQFSWKLEIGAGPGFISKPFDIQSNYGNNAIGSHFNAFIVAGTHIDLKLRNFMYLNASLCFNHFSNAAFTPINLGLNYPMASVGLAYKPHLQLKSQIELDTSLTKQPSFWQWSINSGLKHNNVKREKIYPCLSFNADRVFGLTKKSSISAGLDVFYNTALLDLKKESGLSTARIKNIQAGPHFIYHLNIDKMLLMAGIGIYAIDDYKKDGAIYNRFGLRYYFTDHVGFNLSLKTHFFKADYFELGIAHRF